MVQLLEDLACSGIGVDLVTGWMDVEDPDTLGFQVLSAAPLVKDSTLGRLWSWFRFGLEALVLAARRRQPVLMVTNPPWPMLAMPWIRRLFGLRYVLLIYDIYPEVAERMGMIRPGGRLARWWRRRSRDAMRQAEAVITIGRCMRRTLAEHLLPGDDVEITVIPNWADPRQIRPMDKQSNPFAQAHRLTGKFVVTYSGAFGATHDTESIVAAAEDLVDLPDVHFLLIGGGTRIAEVRRLVQDKELANLTLLDFQPPERFAQALAASDCAIVCLDTPYEGLSVPSKTYSALAAGCAILAVTAEGTELADTVGEQDCGVVVPPKSPDRLAERIREFFTNRARLAEIQEAARRAAETAYARDQAVERYRSLLTRTLHL